MWSIELPNLAEYVLCARHWAKSILHELSHLAFTTALWDGYSPALRRVTSLQVRDNRLSEVSATQSPTACKWRGWNLNMTDLDPKPKLLIMTRYRSGPLRILGTAVSSPSKGRLTCCMVYITGLKQPIVIFCVCVFSGQKYLIFALHLIISQCYLIRSSRYTK